MRISVTLLIDDHSQHMRHCIIHALHTAVLGVLGSGDDFSNAKKLVDRVRKFRAELEAFISIAGIPNGRCTV